MSDLRNEFAWSKSKAKLFSDCKRKYWFGTYGKWNGWEAGADPRAKELYILSNLKNRWMWVGDVVHRSVAEILRAFRDGKDGDPPRVLGSVRNLMTGELSASQRKLYRLQGGHKLCALREHEYDERLQDDAWESAIASAEQCVRNFIDSPLFAQLKSFPRGNWLAMDEKFQSFDLNGVKINLKIDAAHRVPNGGIRIIDWKAGHSEDELGELQLAVYALYAVRQWNVLPDRVIVGVCNLKQSPCGIQEQTPTAQTLQEAEETVQDDVRKMENLLRSGRPANIAEEADYPVTAAPKDCQRCNFWKACPESPLKGEL